MKYEWRKEEKHLYLPKNRPEIINVPPCRFLTINGEGHPNYDWFTAYIESLYASLQGIWIILFIHWKGFGTRMKKQKKYLMEPLIKMTLYIP
jgi:hypothetical protein